MSAAEVLYEIEVKEHAASFTARVPLAQLAGLLAIDLLEGEVDVVDIKESELESNVIDIGTRKYGRTIQS